MSTPTKCRPGDLALVVISKWDCGKMITCLALATEAELKAAGITYTKGGAVWKIDRGLQWARTTVRGDRLPFAPDRCLLPIRPEPEPEPDPESEPEHATNGAGGAA